MDYDIKNYSILELKDLFTIEEGDDVIEKMKEKIKEIKDTRTTVEFYEKSKLLDFMKDALKKIEENTKDTISSSELVINFNDNDKIDFKSSLINTENNKYYKRDVIEKVIVIDSKFRDFYDSTTSSDFNISLASNSINNVIQVQLGDIEFPNTWYPFSNEMGNLSFRIKHGEDTNWKTISIVEGVYSYASLLNNINQSLFESGLTNTIFTINLERDTETGGNNGQATINITRGDENDTETVDIDFFNNVDGPSNVLDAQKTLGWALGFRYTKSIYTGLRQYTGEAVIDTVILRYFYIMLDDGITSTATSNILPLSNNMNIINTTSILARVSVKGSLLSNVNSQGVSLYSDVRKYPSKVNLSKFNIKILNEYGIIVNLHNADVSFTLKVSVIMSS